MSCLKMLGADLFMSLTKQAPGGPPGLAGSQGSCPTYHVGTKGTHGVVGSDRLPIRDQIHHFMVL